LQIYKNNLIFSLFLHLNLESLFVQKGIQIGRARFLYSFEWVMAVDSYTIYTIFAAGKNLNSKQLLTPKY